MLIIVHKIQYNNKINVYLIVIIINHIFKMDIVLKNVMEIMLIQIILNLSSVIILVYIINYRIQMINIVYKIIFVQKIIIMFKIKKEVIVLMNVRIMFKIINVLVNVLENMLDQLNQIFAIILVHSRY